MNEEELKRLEDLKYRYEYARMVCDPIDFIQRKIALLHTLCEFILEPLKEYENKIREEKSGDE